MPIFFPKFARRLPMAGALLTCCAAMLFAQGDPPSRVARLNYLDGAVSMKPAEMNDWFAAEWNRPFSSGDALYTDSGAHAELHVDVAAIRLGPRTNLLFQALTDQALQIGLGDGDLYLRVHNLGPSESLEVDTPNAAVTLLRDGVYRFRVDSAGGVTFLVVRQGTAEVNAAGQAATVNPGNSILIGGGQQAYDLEQAPAEDEFDAWCRARDRHEMQLASARYVPATLIGYEDLDDNGAWEVAGPYGPVWYPRAVPLGWAPYRFGHWIWLSPWGWTWVDDARWGFAPFHYGRWVFVSNRWGWSPGPMVVAQNAPPVRPHYAPALVAWVGGSHWGVSVSVGGPPTAWVALGFGELYTPPYHCSPHYFNNVNVSNTRVVNTVNITNVYQTVYVNKTVYNQTYVHMSSPNAVVAVPASAMGSGRPVSQQAIVLKREEIEQLHSAPAPQVARNAAVAHTASPVPHPPQQAAHFAQMNQQPAPAAVRNQPAAFVQKPPPPALAKPVEKPHAVAPVPAKPVAHEYPKMAEHHEPPKKPAAKPEEHKEKEKERKPEK